MIKKEEEKKIIYTKNNKNKINTSMLSYLLCYNILAENKNKMKIDANLKCKTGDWSCGLKLNTRPTRPQLALENILESRFQRNEVRMVKMRLWDHFIGAYTGWAAWRTLKGRQVCLAHLQGPLVNINRLTFDPKKKKNRVSCPILRTKLEKSFLD